MRGVPSKTALVAGILAAVLITADSTAEAQSTSAASPVNPLLWLGMTPREAFNLLGPPAELFCRRGTDPQEDDVVFYYAEHYYLFWFRDRVWQVRVDHRYQGTFLGLHMGSSMDDVIRSVGRPYRRLSDQKPARGAAATQASRAPNTAPALTSPKNPEERNADAQTGTQGSTSTPGEVSLVFFLPDSSLTPAAGRGGFPIRLRAIFRAGRLVDLYLYRGDF